MCLLSAQHGAGQCGDGRGPAGRQAETKDLVLTFKKVEYSMKSRARTTKGEITCLSLNAQRTSEEGDTGGGFREGIMTEVGNEIAGQKKREGDPSRGSRHWRDYV